MRNKALIVLVMLTTKLASCQQQYDITAKIKDEDFKSYVSTFQLASIPFSTYEEMYCETRVKLSLINKFICSNELCLKDWSGYDIEFSPCKYLPSNGDYVILIHDESTDGGTVRKLSTYDYYGNKLDELDIFADKPFHGEREKNEISHYEIESVISEDLIIEKKYFAVYEEDWKIDGTRYFYGRYIESEHKIDVDGNIVLISERNHGKQIYVGGSIDNNIFPRWKLAQ